MNEILVKELLDMSQPIVESGRDIALIAIKKIEDGQPVAIAMNGVRGVPSAFYHAFFETIASARDNSAISLLHFEFDSESQKSVFARALAAFTIHTK